MTEIIIIIVCLFCSAFFSASETAYSSLNRNRLRLMADNKRRGASLAYRLSEKYDSLLSSILIGNNIVNIALASVSTIFFVRLIGNAGASISTAVITVAVLIFGEITPKSVAKDYPEKFACFSAPFLYVLTLILTPVNFLFSAWKKLIGKMFGAREDNALTAEELLLMLEEVEKDGTIDRSEGELLVNAVKFDDITAEKVLTHRTDVAAVGIDWDRERIAGVFADSGFSRLPVFEDDLDHVKGILHYKDFFSADGVSGVPARELIKPPVFAGAGEKLSDVLKLMKKHKCHMCIVVDEYGGTSGIVTMEDILEELVGEIWDEHDVERQEVVEKEDGSFTVDGLMAIGDFSERFDIEPETDSNSVGGWVTERLGRLPSAGDSFTEDNLVIAVRETDGRRVSSVSVTPVPAEDGSVDGDGPDRGTDKKQDKN